MEEFNQRFSHGSADEGTNHQREAFVTTKSEDSDKVTAGFTGLIYPVGILNLTWVRYDCYL